MIWQAVREKIEDGAAGVRHSLVALASAQETRRMLEPRNWERIGCGVARALEETSSCGCGNLLAVARVPSCGMSSLAQAASTRQNYFSSASETVLSSLPTQPPLLALPRSPRRKTYLPAENPGASLTSPCGASPPLSRARSCGAAVYEIGCAQAHLPTCSCEDWHAMCFWPERHESCCASRWESWDWSPACWSRIYCGDAELHPRPDSEPNPSCQLFPGLCHTTDSWYVSDFGHQRDVCALSGYFALLMTTEIGLIRVRHSARGAWTKKVGVRSMTFWADS